MILIRPLVLASLGAALSGGAVAAQDTRVALVPGGPHPYFAAWEQAGADAAKDFGLAAADYRVPQQWELSEQNQLLESLLTQGYNGFLIFPGDPVGTNSIVGELTGEGATVISLAGCLQHPVRRQLLPWHRHRQLGLSRHQGADQAMGGKGRIAHFTGFLVDPNTQLRIDAVQQRRRRDERRGRGRAGHRRHRRARAGRGEDQRLPRRRCRQRRRHRHHRLGPGGRLANALRRIGDKRIKMVGIDHDEVVLEAIKDGFVDGTMLQNPYGQGYIGSFAADRLRNGCTVKADAPFGTTAQTDKFIDSGTVFVAARQGRHLRHRDAGRSPRT